VRVLIDTHVWLWRSRPTSDSEDARDLIQDPDNEVLLSVAPAWEIGIKAAKGKLDLPAPAEVFTL
jgi:PIN domain nuclease of toxin-antitoxin system